MTWEKTHLVTAKDLRRADLWRVWTDVNLWHLWDLDIEYARMTETFGEGARFLLKPKGGPKVTIEIVQVATEVSFTDLTRFPLARMYGIHSMCETAAGLEVSHTVRVEGPLGWLWRKIVADGVAAGLEAQATAMLARARELASGAAARA